MSAEASPGLSIDPARTRVIMVGTSECPRDRVNFPDLPEVKENLKALKGLLTDPTLIGVPDDLEHVMILQDVPSASAVAEGLRNAARADIDTLLFYYGGHGTIGEVTSDLLLVVGDTTFDSRDDNALPASTIRRLIRMSPALKKILIIDSCFSGRIFDVMAPQPDFLRSKIEVQGTFAIASAPPNELAKAKGIEGCTAFTGHLVQTLRAGIPTDQKVLTLDSIYQWVKKQLCDGYPIPQRATWQDAGQLAVAINRGYTSHPTWVIDKEATKPDTVYSETTGQNITKDDTEKEIFISVPGKWLDSPESHAQTVLGGIRKWLHRSKGEAQHAWRVIRKTPGEVSIQPGQVYRLMVANFVHDHELVGLDSLWDLSLLHELSLEFCDEVTDAGLAHLHGLTELRSLNLEGCKLMTDAGLSHLRRLTELQSLKLRSSNKTPF
jgi:hypothetical protein